MLIIMMFQIVTMMTIRIIFQYPLCSSLIVFFVVFVLLYKGVCGNQEYTSFFTAHIDLIWMLQHIILCVYTFQFSPLS